MKLLPDSAPRAVLDVPAVMARYGLRDRRSARRVMDAAGAYLVGGRLLVLEADLAAHEETLKAGRMPATAAAKSTRGTPAPRRSRQGRQRPAQPREQLAPGWWRNPPAGGQDGSPEKSA